ncbi:MAG: TMEM175 family protein [Sediminicola sp.]
MKTDRLEAFTDAVLAIVITIMVLELKAPELESAKAILDLLPVFISYLLSFVYLGIYWSNHHHLFKITEKINGKGMWSNLLLIFWLSLIPFATSLVGEHYSDPRTIAFYGFILLMSAISYRILEICLMKYDMSNSILRNAVRRGRKETISTILYIVAIPLAFVNIWLAIVLYVLVASSWVVPDKRVERSFGK